MENNHIHSEEFPPHIRIQRTALSPEKREAFKKRLDIRIKEEKSNRRRHSIYLFSKAVAALVILIIAGVITMNYMKPEETSFEQYMASSISKTEYSQPYLIRPNGEQYALLNKESVHYVSGGKIVIYNKDGEIRQSFKTGTENADNKLLSRIIVPYGSNASIRLSDGSKIWANAGTTVVFPETFTGNQRNVGIEGEAYLEIATDKTKPFFVYTQKYTVEVVGTAFNISSYADDQHPSVVLLNGKVEMSHNGKKIQLRPNEKGEIIAGNINKTSVNASDYISWKNGILTFRNEPLENVLQKIARYYNLQLHLCGLSGSPTCSGKLDLNEDIEKVIESIKSTMNINLILSDGKLAITK